MRGFERLQLAHQRVELGVGDFGRGVDVVELFVTADFPAELLDAFGGSHDVAQRHGTQKHGTPNVSVIPCLRGS